MDFEIVIDRIARFMEERQAPFFLIGGLAMHAFGSSRLTNDVDFLTRLDIRDTLVEEMERLGYETLNVSPGFSNHLHEDHRWGRVDFVYSGPATVEKLISQSRRHVTVSGHTIPVPAAEHLIAMKVLAMKNEPRRTLTEMSDIQFLMSLPDTDLSRAREYFEKYGLLRRYDEIREVGF